MGKIFPWHDVSVLQGRPEGRGLFHECFVSSPKQSRENTQCQKSHLWWEFQAKTLYMCPKPWCTKFQLEILIRNTISAIHKFRENILESSRNVSETTPRYLMMYSLVQHAPTTTTWFHPLMSDKASNFTDQSITYSIDCLVGSWHTSPQSFAIPVIYANKSPNKWILGTRSQLGWKSYSGNLVSWI